VVDGIPDGAVFTIEETAGLLKVPVETVEQMVVAKEIRAIRLGGFMRIPRRAIFAALRGMTAAEFDEHILQQPSPKKRRDAGR
jgi:excisionase family DNA binding protein